MSVNDQVAIRVSRLVKTYPKSEKRAVDEIDLEVKKGEIYGFLGPNGAGKSTTIKILTTTLFPSSGSVEVAGLDVTKHPREVRQAIGVVFQQLSLDEKLTIFDNLRSQAIMYGLTPFRFNKTNLDKSFWERSEYLLKLMDLWDRRDAGVDTLSGGLKRRVDIVKALLHLPQILFLDEPTTGLDPQSRKLVWEHIKKLQQESGFTVFLTTQYLEEAEICDRISIIDNGKIHVTDTPRKLKDKLNRQVLRIRGENRSKLEKEISKLGIPFSIQNEDWLAISLQPEQSAHNLLKQIKTELTDIDVNRPSLDDVFLQYTGHGWESKND